MLGHVVVEAVELLPAPLAVAVRANLTRNYGMLKNRKKSSLYKYMYIVK
jgi:hypothetical protein